MIDAHFIAKMMDEKDPLKRARIIAALRVLRVSLAFDVEAWSVLEELHVIAMKNSGLDNATLDMIQAAADAGWSGIDTYLHARGK